MDVTKFLIYPIHIRFVNRILDRHIYLQFSLFFSSCFIFTFDSISQILNDVTLLVSKTIN